MGSQEASTLKAFHSSERARLSFSVLTACCLLPTAYSEMQTPPTASLKPIEVKVPSRKEPVSYAKDIAEILENKCVGCHGAVLAENRLNLESVAGMLKGGKRGPAVVAGKADESLLFTMAAHRLEPVDAAQGQAGQQAAQLGGTWPVEALDRCRRQGRLGRGRRGQDEEPKTIELGDLPPGVQPINAVDLTADGARVAAGRANVVQVYDVDSGLEIVSLGGHKDLIQSLRFSPDGTFWPRGATRSSRSGMPRPGAC